MLILNPDLDFWNSDPKIHFWANLGPKIQSCPFCLKIGTHGISRMLILIPTLVFWMSNPNFLFGQIWAKKSQSCLLYLKIDTHRNLEVQIPNPDLDFWNSNPKIHLWANLGQKSQSCPFFLKIGTHGILAMLILIPALVFWISNPKSIYGKIWTKKVNVIQFGWKLPHRMSWRCWFLFQHYFSQFPTLNSRMLTLISTIAFWIAFLGKFGLKKSKLLVLPENWHTRTHTHRVSRRCWFLFWY